jgi:hypothetical protein
LRTARRADDIAHTLDGANVTLRTRSIAARYEVRAVHVAAPHDRP